MNSEYLEELKANNFQIKIIKPDVKDFVDYLKKADYHLFRHYYSGRRAYLIIEKALEHYLAAKLLNLTKEDVYIDVANYDSPAPDIYHKLYGCKTYRQDLVFPEGITGNRIGGDASNMPVEDGFATKMALHCSFECFEHDSDIKFIVESNRILRKGGKLCILPLYLFNQYAFKINPVMWPRGNAELERDVTIYCVKGWGTKFVRYYDVPTFISRIRSNLGNLKLTIYNVQPKGYLAGKTYVRIIALFEKI